MKRVFVLLLTLSLILLSGCGPKIPDITVPTQDPTEAPTQAPTLSPVEPVTDPPTEPGATLPTQLGYTNPLTGEPLDEPVTTRPFICTLNNAKAAMPHCGNSQADIIYEFLAEGGVTRCLALFNDVRDVEKYGPVRSARVYFVNTASAYDALFAHAGGNTYSAAEFKRLDVSDLDAIIGAGAPYFWRDQDRLSAGYSLEHTLFTSGEKLTAYAEKRGYDLTRTMTDFGLHFTENAAQEGDPAEKVVVSFRKNGKTTTFTYHEDTGLYTAYQHKQDYIDGNTGELVTFKNLLVLEASVTSGKSDLQFYQLVGSGTGHFICNGKVIPILWSRVNDYAPFTYALEDGTPLEMGIGNSYIAFVPNGSPLTCE